MSDPSCGGGSGPSPETPPSPKILQTTSTITAADRWDHFLARWGVRRGEHCVAPGLYALGRPTAQSPVLVSANYTLSFDALRSALPGRDAFILVLDTRGINVWCAAGKGTFGTDELVRRIDQTGLREVVDHRVLILPQLGAPGVAAHEVKRRSGFKVRYGPIRAHDLPAFLESGEATPEMRRVRFDLLDRLVLIPVEVVQALLPTLGVAAVLYLAAGLRGVAGLLAAVAAGVVLFPLLLPWLPTPNFSTKGFVLGGVVVVPFGVAAFLSAPGPPLWRAAPALVCLLALPPVTAFLALNFTGSTTFTSRSGVTREIFAYVPRMAWMVGSGLAIAAVSAVVGLLGARP